MAEPSQKAHITLSNIYFSSGLMLHPKLSKVLALVESRCPDLFVHHDPLPQPHYPLAEPIAHLSHSKTLCSDHMRNQTDVVDQSESEELLIDKRLEIDRTNTDLNNLNSEPAQAKGGDAITRATDTEMNGPDAYSEITSPLEKSIVEGVVHRVDVPLETSDSSDDQNHSHVALHSIILATPSPSAPTIGDLEMREERKDKASIELKEAIFIQKLGPPTSSSELPLPFDQNVVEVDLSTRDGPVPTSSINCSEDTNSSERSSIPGTLLYCHCAPKTPEPMDVEKTGPEKSPEGRLTDNHLLDHYKLSSPISISRTKTNPSAIPPGIYDLEGDTGAIMDLQSLRQTPTSKRPRDEKEDPLHTPSKVQRRIPSPKTTPRDHDLRSRHSKLLQPFRSPMLQKLQTPRTPTASSSRLESASSPIFKVPSAPSPLSMPRSKADATQSVQQPNLKATPRKIIKSSITVMKPFKSPFKSPLSSLSSSTKTASSSPNIQALERKVQLLKQAIKIKAANEEEKLEQLTKKWRDVGREVAWELWAAVKDREMGGNWGGDSQGGSETWGWDDKKDDKKNDIEETGGMPNDATEDDMRYEEDSTGHEKDIEEKQTPTLGTMLRSFGVSDEILGWDESREDFVDLM